MSTSYAGGGGGCVVVVEVGGAECKKSRNVSATMCDVMMTLINMIEDKKAFSIQMRCAHTEVRLCIVQLSCVCLWTNGKRHKQCWCTMSM